MRTMTVHTQGCLSGLRLYRRLEAHGLSLVAARDFYGCGPGLVFVCIGCGGRSGYCRGAHDDMPEHCDECWTAAHAGDDS